jgi:hypothetical protein
VLTWVLCATLSLLNAGIFPPFSTQGFYLTEDDVMAMWDVYKEVIAGRKVTNVRITEIFQHLVRPTRMQCIALPHSLCCTRARVHFRR